MFTFAKSYATEKYPFAEMKPTTASETYVIGEALVLSSGKVTKAGQTDKPTFICGQDYVAPSSGNLDIKVYPVLPHYEYRTAFAKDATLIPIGSKVTLDTTGLLITASTGTHQYTTATIAGEVTTAGNALVTVTSALFDNPVAVDVPVELGDTANAIALAIRTALAADEDIAANFAVSGATNKVILTPLVYAADDATLNIAVDDGTGDGASAGVTTDATSDSTAGVASTGVATITQKFGTGAVGTEVSVRFI